MRKNLIPAALVLMVAAGLAACAPGGGSGPGSPTAAPSSASSAPASPGTSPTAVPGQGDAELAVLFKSSADAKAVSYTLRCSNGEPAAGSNHPTAAAACAAVKQNPAILSPGPRPTDRACTQQYGGPQTATVTGTVDGKTVKSEFSRTDGCEIELWNAAKDVLGSSGGA
ncbi:SSI family serine proteinase inhibitor [Arthrobacter sp. Hor0625]|uniref:SSI family serine proteinase inhibitor n=1 Tax=Arthrobacter sp. Hor0625 TaxID=3457358 RepID=UPI00403E97DE